jgi:hypothetical protein
MTTAEIHEMLDSMLENPKSRNFLTHLIKNYIPTSNIEKVLTKPNSAFKCVLTKDELSSVEEIISGIESEDYRKNFNDYLTHFLDKSFNGETPIGKLIGEKKMGFTGKETTTFMCFNALQEFYNWVIYKSLSGNKHINWVLGDKRHSFYTKKSPKTRIQNKSLSTFTLGQVKGFNELKGKFKNAN